MMSKFFASATSPEVTSNTLSPAASSDVSTSPMEIVYLPAGNCVMLTLKLFPLISSRNAAALSPAPSMVTDSPALRCAKSPVTLTCSPQLEQISSAAKAAGTPSHKQASDARVASASDPEKPRKPGNRVATVVRARILGSRRMEGASVRSNGGFVSGMFIFLKWIMSLLGLKFV